MYMYQKKGYDNIKIKVHLILTNKPKQFQGNVNIFDIMEHLNNLEAIAQDFQNSRAMNLVSLTFIEFINLFF